MKNPEVDYLVGRGDQGNIHQQVSQHAHVIVMTFWYVIGTDLTSLFSNFFKLLFSLGIDHDPPCSLCSHDPYFILLFMFHSSHDYTAKRSRHHIMIFYLEYY